VVVTYSGVPATGTTQPNTLQIVIYSTGKIELNVGALAGTGPVYAPKILGTLGIALGPRRQHQGAQRSDIVGKPVAMLLTNGNATVTICHSKTRDLPGVCRRADILVAAIGRTGMITPEYVKPGACVIDVGMNKITDRAEFAKFFAGDAKREAAFAKNGSTLIGDVDPKVAEVAGALTPVPGGVGPLTIAMLMSNTVKAAKLRRG